MSTLNGKWSFKSLIQQQELVIFLLIVIMSIALNYINAGFLTPANFKPMSRGIAIEGFIVIGMTFLLISGVFDISVGSVMAFSGFVFTSLAANGVNVYLAIVAALATGVVIGIVNGLIVTKIKVNPFIATLATMTIVRGLVLALSQGNPIRVSKPEFIQFSATEVFGIPAVFIFFFLILVCADYMLRKIRYLRQFYFIGGNENSATLTGINVDKTRIILFVVIAVLTSLSGVLSSSRLEASVPNAFVGIELKILVACVLGGCSLNGGSGSILGSVLGLVFLFLLDNGLVMLGVDIYWFNGVLGVFLVGVVLLNSYSNSIKERKLKRVLNSLSQQ
jgi:ribose transport system permease protein